MSTTTYRSVIVFIAMIGVVLLSYLLGIYAGPATTASSLTTLLMIAIGGIIAVGIILQPSVGIIAIVGVLPILDILPDNAFPMLGILTLGSFLASRLVTKKRQFTLGFTSVHIIALLFVAWIFISNPGAALPTGDRNWIFTFIQLFILVWLTSELIDTPARHELLMWAFTASSLFSAFVILQQASIDVSQSNFIGVSGTANAAGRYFVVSIVFLMYLKNRIRRFSLLFILGSFVLLLLGLWFSSSRSMFLVLGVVFLFFIFQAMRSRNPGVDKRRQLFTIGILPIAVVIIVIQVGGLDFLQTNVIGTLEDNGDTVGVRSRLWEAGLRMWSDHPLTGVGIGQFPANLPYYGQDLLASQYLDAGPHNMYIAVLSETGLVGLTIFGALLIVSLRSFWKIIQHGSREQSTIAWTWLIVFTVMLLGGITKHDQYDKFVWTCIGAAGSFSRLAVRIPRANKVPQNEA